MTNLRHMESDRSQILSQIKLLIKINIINKGRYFLVWTQYFSNYISISTPNLFTHLAPDSMMRSRSKNCISEFLEQNKPIQKHVCLHSLYRTTVARTVITHRRFQHPPPAGTSDPDYGVLEALEGPWDRYQGACLPVKRLVLQKKTMTLLCSCFVNWCFKLNWWCVWIMFSLKSKCLTIVRDSRDIYLTKLCL